MLVQHKTGISCDKSCDHLIVYCFFTGSSNRMNMNYKQTKSTGRLTKCVYVCVC